MWSCFSVRDKVILVILVALLAAGVVWRIYRPAALIPGMEKVDPLTEVQHPQEGEPELITVHLVGAVQTPGVYRLAAGSRVHEALELAGGPTDDADLERVNLARPLYDGEQVVFYRAGESPAPGSNPGSSKININLATAEELIDLPGIGEVRAQRIIEYREKHGFFTDITEIMDVSGIGTGIFNQIKDLITIY